MRRVLTRELPSLKKSVRSWRVARKRWTECLSLEKLFRTRRRALAFLLVTLKKLGITLLTKGGGGFVGGFSRGRETGWEWVSAGDVLPEGGGEVVVGVGALEGGREGVEVEGGVEAL